MNNRETMPTKLDQQHITPLAQKLLDMVQEYARENGMTFPGVMSAIGTMAGALLAKAYNDHDLAKSVADRITICAVAMVDVMHVRDRVIRGRRQ